MRILLVTQYFVPEITAAPVRLHPFAAGLAARGHEVEVVCEAPSHPGGIVHPGYGGRPVDHRRLDGFDVSYVWTATSTSKRARSRLASYASYAAMALAVGSLRGRPDVVVASSPPLSVGVVGAALAFRHRVPWLLDVRDLWPEAAVVFGEVSNRRVIRGLEWLERRLYRGARAITTPTEPFRRHISERCEDPGKVRVLPNGTTRTWLAAGEAEPARAQLGLPEDRFIWTYAGNLGLSQDLETAIGAAELLGEGYELLILGEGASKRRLEQATSRMSVGSVRFAGPVPEEAAARYLRSSDALLVPLADRPELGKSVPIKLFDYAAVGRPIVVAAPGEPRRIAEREGIALTCAPGDPAALAAAVRRLREAPELGQRLATAAREFARRNLREEQVDRLIRLLAGLS